MPFFPRHIFSRTSRISQTKPLRVMRRRYHHPEALSIHCPTDLTAFLTPNQDLDLIHSKMSPQPRQAYPTLLDFRPYLIGFQGIHSGRYQYPPLCTTSDRMLRVIPNPNFDSFGTQVEGWIVPQHCIGHSHYPANPRDWIETMYQGGEKMLSQGAR